MHFKAEELTTKVFPGSRGGLWACHQDTLGGGDPCTDGTDITCPQDTMPGPPGDGDPPCPGNTDQPCPQDTMAPGDGDDGDPPCPQDTMPPTTHPPRSPHKAAGTLSLLQAQLRERLAEGAIEAGF